MKDKSKNMQKTIEQQATDIINQLKESFLKEPAFFDFSVSQYISGDYNKPLRQEITKQLTGESRPISKCGMYAVSDVLKASFQQYSMFA